ncbi:MAG: hypothetical protein VR69_16280 [Peptococcaceae bacterium BRH_c4b]|nr:MAG: hypothetical protein VR69_16280 [Peptococcaceae bacterium BRH_c4b]
MLVKLLQSPWDARLSGSAVRKQNIRRYPLAVNRKENEPMDNEKYQEFVLQRLEEQKQFQELVIKHFQNLSGELKTLNQQVENLEQNQSRMENSLNQDIKALFDAFSLRGDQIINLQKNMDERLDNIEIDTGYLVSKVARLEKLAK